MRIGVVFPTYEFGADIAAVRDFVLAAEALGFDHMVAYDHVLGLNPASSAGRRARYTNDHAFYDPFVLFGFAAGLTTRLGLFTGVVVLPQRQAVLVAKQAAEVDVLSHGRLRLGIGVGVNAYEYEALGQDFATRGSRVEEQIEVMRALWGSELVTFEGRWHRISDAGIKPLPVQRPIPIWLGGQSDAALRRVARLADGWYPLITPGGEAGDLMSTMRRYAREEGRDPAAIEIETRIVIGDREPAAWADEVALWQGLGASRVSLHTMNGELASPAAHIDAIERFKRALDGR